MPLQDPYDEDDFDPFFRNDLDEEDEDDASLFDPDEVRDLWTDQEPGDTRARRLRERR